MADLSPTLLWSLAITSVAGLLVVASTCRVPRSILLFGGGAVLAGMLGSPRQVVDPGLLLGFLLPPLLYAATVTTSLDLVKRVLVSGLLAGALLACLTIAAVAVAAGAMLPHFAWSSLVLLGVVVAVSDTRLIDELGHEARVPRPVADALRGQSLAAPFVLLSTATLVADHLGSAPPRLVEIAATLALDWLVGGAVGIVIGWLVSRLRRGIDTGPIEISVSIATPFAITAVAELLGLSVIAPLVTAALTISAASIDPRTGRAVASSDARLIARNFWREATLVLGGLQFFLTGFVLPGVLTQIDSPEIQEACAVAFALLLVVGSVQVTFAYIAAHLWSADKRRASRRNHALLIGLLPSRSSLGLLIALGLPTTLPEGRAFPERDLILVVTAMIVVVSVLLKWLTLSVILNRLAAQQERSGESAQSDAILAGVDGSNTQAVRRARTQLLARRRAGDLGDKSTLDANTRLDAAAYAHATLNASSSGSEPR
jgi:monovalent cation/hydrogen antiporter